MRTAIQLGVVGAAAAFGALLAAQQFQLQRLRGELCGLRAAQAAGPLTVETRRIDGAPVAVVGGSQRAAELPQLRAELAALKARFDEMKQVERPKPQSATMRSWAAEDWRNAGRATPQAALETALWAATAGELEVLAETLVLDERARAAAEQLLSNLPPETRTDYARPERLIALLAAKDVPASTVMVHVSELSSEVAGETRWRVKLQDVSGATRTARLTLRPAAGGWNLIVSERDVARFAANLKR